MYELPLNTAISSAKNLKSGQIRAGFNLKMPSGLRIKLSKPALTRS
jgi:hypothetical protein